MDGEKYIRSLSDSELSKMITLNSNLYSKLEIQTAKDEWVKRQQATKPKPVAEVMPQEENIVPESSDQNAIERAVAIEEPGTDSEIDGGSETLYVDYHGNCVEIDENNINDTDDQVIYCMGCGWKLPADAAYCQRCGREVELIKQDADDETIEPAHKNIIKIVVAILVVIITIVLIINETV